jgi:DNA modification methylase
MNGTLHVRGQTFIVGDCVTEMGKMADGSINHVVTSPPYNLEMKYNDYDDNLASTTSSPHRPTTSK